MNEFEIQAILQIALDCIDTGDLQKARGLLSKVIQEMTGDYDQRTRRELQIHIETLRKSL